MMNVAMEANRLTDLSRAYSGNRRLPYTYPHATECTQAAQDILPVNDSCEA